METTSFQFPRLPAELRVQIWRFHLAHPREIYITVDNKDHHHFIIENQTPLLSVNKESRHETLTYHRSRLGASYSDNVLIDETTRCECITYLHQMYKGQNPDDAFTSSHGKFLSSVRRKKPGVWFNPHLDILRMTTHTFAYLPDIIKERCQLLRLDIRGDAPSKTPMLGGRSHNFTNPDGDPGRDSWWMPGIRECVSLQKLELVHDIPYLDGDSERWDMASKRLASSYDRVIEMMGCRIAGLWVGGQCKGTVRTWGAPWLQETDLSRPSLDKMLLKWRPHS